MGSILMDASLRLSVCVRRSTMPDARWSWVGEKKSLMFFSLQYVSKALDSNACAWSQRMLWEIPWDAQYRLRSSIAVLVSQLVRFIAEGYRDNRSTAARM